VVDRPKTQTGNEKNGKPAGPNEIDVGAFQSERDEETARPFDDQEVMTVHELSIATDHTRPGNPDVDPPGRNGRCKRLFESIGTDKIVCIFDAGNFLQVLVILMTRTGPRLEWFEDADIDPFLSQEGRQGPSHEGLANAGVGACDEEACFLQRGAPLSKTIESN
jgi:hypothetical protein